MKTLGQKYNEMRNLKKGSRMTLSEAGRLLRKRISVSRQLLAAGQIWKNSLPSHDCDVVVTFPQSTTEETLVWLLTQLKTNVPELLVEVRHHRHTNVYGFYLTTSFENLLKGAEEERLRKPLKQQFGGGMKEFVYEERECFEQSENKDVFLSSQERQSIILNLLYGLRASDKDEVLNIKFIEGQPIVPKCLAEGVISQVLPLHSCDDLNKLKRTWMQAFLKHQPLNDICDYFGVKIAIYFAWLGHYTKALTVPAFFGLFMWLCYYGKDQATEDVCFVVFALFNVLWATLYLESWKRNCAELAYRWGTLDIQNELLAEPRPLFTGPLAISPITGRMEPTYPAWKRNLFRYCVSLPVIAFCLLIVFLVMFLIFELQTWWDRMIDSRGFPFWMTLFPKVLLALVINVFDGVYHRIAVWLNDKENYRGEEEYENHLVAKELLFQFVNSFLSLFYIAFYLQDMEKLKEQLAALLITRQVVGNIKESLIPFLTETFKLAHLGADHTTHSPSGSENEQKDLSSDQDSEPMSSASSTPVHDSSNKRKHNNLTQAEVESAMYKYEGTFEDYLEMFIQFGYVILFSSAFPMAAMCALLNNVIEIRSDAFKLCMIFQRPFSQRAENIGTWQDAMEVMGVIAVIVNCALIGMSGQVQRMFPNLSTQGTIVLIVILEHLILSIKFGIAYAIPDVPQWVATKMAKVEFQRREAVKHFHRSSLSKKKRKMEYKNSSFDSSPSKPKNRKPMNILKKKDSFSQTEPCESLSKQNSESNLSIGSSPSSNKFFLASESNNTADNVPQPDDGSITYLYAAESLHTEPSLNIPSNNCELPSENIPVIRKDLDAMSINFETPYLSNQKRVQRKLSLPQIKILKKNSSQESDSPPDGTPSGSGPRKISNSSSSSRFFSSLKKRKHALKRALSFQNSSTSSEDKLQAVEPPNNDGQQVPADKQKTV
ncbi:anoctamin-8-like [Uloborus diversus]|uniref:anoctamin-8-like n=1 Tax=Uloborus diversus TaxID=327109 RepID=UPI00240A0062|nr:anoctamin-8-like [Uloborus diversus]